MQPESNAGNRLGANRLQRHDRAAGRDDQRANTRRGMLRVPRNGAPRALARRTGRDCAGHRSMPRAH